MDFARVFSELNSLVANGIIASYALAGAVGAQRYIKTRATLDVDFYVIFNGESLNQLEPLMTYLSPRGAVWEGPFIKIGGWPVQFIPVGSSLQEDGIKASRSVDVDGVRVAVMTAEHLAAIALETGREKDRERVRDFLQLPKFDRATFEALVARHGLAEKWMKFDSDSPGPT